MSRFLGLRLRSGGTRPPRNRLRLAGDVFLATFVFGLLVLVAARIDEGAAVRIEGRVEVTDGDSLVIETERIRLRGIDAPELGQTCRRDGRDYACGREAKRALVDLVGSFPVACTGRERDRYDRLLAGCSAQQTDLARAQVAAGWAVAVRSVEKGEAAARGGRRGGWGGPVERPRPRRASHGAAAEAEHARPSSILAWLRAILGFP